MKNKKTKINTILFDIGDTLVYPNSDKSIRYLAKKMGVQAGDLSYFIKPMLRGARLGALKLEDIITDISRIFDVPKARIEINNYMRRFTRPNTALIGLAEKLSKNYRLAILSNIAAGEYRVCAEKFDKDIFDRRFLSYRIKLRKPDPRIFDYAVRELNVDPNQIIFIDDLEENILTARKSGLNAVQYTTMKKLRYDLKKFGIYSG